METKRNQHALAFVRWIDSCDSVEQLCFCSQVMHLFLFAGTSWYRAPVVCGGGDVASYLSLCIHQKLQVLSAGQSYSSNKPFSYTADFEKYIPPAFPRRESFKIF